MKLFFTSLFLLLSLNVFAASADVKVNGMVCSFCGQGITKKFKEQTEVKDIKVDMDKKIVSISFNDGKSLEDQKIIGLLRDAGYSVEGITRQ